MADTLLPGDFLLVNLAAYDLHTPTQIPVFGTSLKPITLFNISTPEINDLVLFKFPDINVHIKPYNGESLIKRIIACSGDTLQIIQKHIYVNRKELILPLSSRRSFDNIKQKGKEEESIYFKGSGWNSDNYGPIVIPSKGDTIEISKDNLHIWQQLIVFEYKKKVVRVEGSVITISGKPVRSYIVQKNHYFVIGDNFNNSTDSRYFGFVDEDMIIGKVMFIYWSMDEQNDSENFFQKIRWDRIFESF
jgi:signal peptidase I